MESIRNTLDRRVQFYEDEIRKLSEQRLMPVWNFCNFFILKVCHLPICLDIEVPRCLFIIIIVFDFRPHQ